MHRAAFVPETVWIEGNAGLLVPLHRIEDPDHWLELAYADDAVITQVDDGQPEPDGTGRRISSSASMPSVVAQMLAHTDAQPGHRVLEIGTGTGYNAALLAHRLGAENVVTAMGHIAGKAGFMTLRQQRFVHSGLTLTAKDDAQATVTETDIHPAEVANGDVAFDACIAIALRVPDCDMSYSLPELDEDGEGILWLVDYTSGSWARLHHHPDHDGPYRVLQSGSRHLWDEVEASYCWWHDAGCPSADRWRFTVTPGGQHTQMQAGPARS